MFLWCKPCHGRAGGASDVNESLHLRQSFTTLGIGLETLFLRPPAINEQNERTLKI